MSRRLPAERFVGKQDNRRRSSARTTGNSPCNRLSLCTTADAILTALNPSRFAPHAIVFGQVRQGQETVDAVQQGDELITVTISEEYDARESGG